MKQIQLDDERRQDFILKLKSFFRDEFDEELSDFRADVLLDLFLGHLGPAVYNQAVQDVRSHLQVKLDDLDGDVFAVTSR
ncbi:MAG: DUF2164 domain-containing protein [Pseudomonadota bacterium]